MDLWVKVNNRAWSQDGSMGEKENAGSGAKMAPWARECCESMGA